MVVSFDIENKKHLKAVFKIGIFGAYSQKQRAFLEGLKLFQRKDGYCSTFLVKDYLDFLDDREKSFYFVRNCQHQFFMLSKIGRGGVIIETEEYTRNVAPLMGRTAYIVLESEKIGDNFVDEVSSLLETGSFNLLRYTTPVEASKGILGQIDQRFFEHYQNGTMIIGVEHTLKCEKCGKTKVSIYALIDVLKIAVSIIFVLNVTIKA